MTSFPSRSAWRRCVASAVALAIALTAAPAADAQTPPRPKPPAAQNVVVFIGNGLGPVTTTAARLMRYKEEGSLAMDGMPYVARVRTWALDAQTSESAAAVSALLTGVKVRNDVVAMDENTRALGYAPGRDAIRNVATAENRCPASGNGNPRRTCSSFAIARNRATGIVTTAHLTSGAAAAAQLPSRRRA